jgi:hypothetical protein
VQAARDAGQPFVAYAKKCCRLALCLLIPL